MKKPPPIHPAGTFTDLDPMPLGMPRPVDVFPETAAGSRVRFIDPPTEGDAPTYVTDGVLAIERKALAKADRATGAYATRLATQQQVRIPWGRWSRHNRAAGESDMQATFTGTIPQADMMGDGYAIATLSDGRQAVFQPHKAAVLAALLAKRSDLHMTVATTDVEHVRAGTLRVWTGDWRCVALLMPVLLGARVKK